MLPFVLIDLVIVRVLSEVSAGRVMCEHEDRTDEPFKVFSHVYIVDWRVCVISTWEEQFDRLLSVKIDISMGAKV